MCAPPSARGQEAQEAEACQEELAMKVEQLKAELVVFKGLMSNVSPWHWEAVILPREHEGSDAVCLA